MVGMNEDSKQMHIVNLYDPDGKRKIRNLVIYGENIMDVARRVMEDPYRNYKDGDVLNIKTSSRENEQARTAKG